MAGAKLGKLGGVKEAYRTDAGGHEIRSRDDPAPDDGEALLDPLIRDGEIVDGVEFGIDAAAARAEADAELCGYGDDA